MAQVSPTARPPRERPEFQSGAIDIQFLERREDLLRPSPDEGRDLRIAVAAALAEAELRLIRKPAVAGQGEERSAWAAQGRLEALR